MHLRRYLREDFDQSLWNFNKFIKKRIEPSLPFGLFDQLSSMKDPVGHGPFQQIPIVTIFLQRSSLYPSTKMTSCAQINSGWFRRHNVLYSRTTRWRGPYYQFCLAKLLILFYFFSASFLMMFFSFIQHQQQKINHSEETITHKHFHYTDVVVLGPECWYY